MDIELPSPSFCIDLDRVEANTSRFLALVSSQGLHYRPHAKTSKCKEVVQLMVGGRKSNGIVVSTLAEAEYFAAHGFLDITYGVPLEPSKYRRIFALPASHERLTLRVMIDTLEGCAALLAYAESASLPPMNVWVAVDAGYGREGVAHDSDAAIDLIKAIQASGGKLILSGLYSHSGDSYNCGREGAARVGSSEFTRMVALAKKATHLLNIPIPTLSLGATPSVHSGGVKWEGQGESPPHIELHPGNYSFFDRQQVESGSCGLEDVGVYVVSRVLAQYRERNTLLIDAGGCAMHKDSGGLDTWGCFRDDPNLVLVKMTQEVSVVSTRDGAPIPWEKYPLGQVVRVLPNHSCMTAAQHPVYHVTRKGVEGGEGEGMPRRVVDAWVPAKYW
jgi:D-serine deaminase-like pyridoxal phosphate-dependent protein